MVFRRTGVGGNTHTEKKLDTIAIKNRLMERTKLNINQLSGLLILVVGLFIENYFQNLNGMIFMFFGSLIFLISSKINIGVIISLVAISIGYIFKIMHYSNGNNIILIGLIGFFISGLIEYINKHRNFEFLSIFISITIILLGVNVKIFHLNFSKEIIIIGVSSLFISYSYRFIKKNNKIFDDYNKLSIVFLWSISYLLRVFHLEWNRFVSSIFFISFLIWLIISFIREVKSTDKKEI